MKLRKLPKTDMEVSEISFGCMSLGEDHTENARLLFKSLEAGINFFDTADLYQRGENEISVGKALKGMRQKVFIATKVGNQLREDGSGQWDWNPSKEYILKAIHKSLKRLQTDYIDLYQLHGGTIDDPIDEVVEAFETLKKQGYIRHYGISSIRPNVIREYVSRSNIVSVMMQYNLLDRRPEESCFQLLEDNDIGVIGRGGIARGLLAGKPAQPYLDYTEEEVQKMVRQVEGYSSEKRSMPQTALNYILNASAVTTITVGFRTENQLEAILGNKTVPNLKESELKALQTIIEPHQYKQHR